MFLTAMFLGTLTFMGKYALLHNPILSINCSIFAAYNLYKLWKYFASEIRSTLLYYVLWWAEMAAHFRQEFLIIDENRSARRLRNRALLRCTIFFIMAQYCIVPKHTFSWLYSLLAYKFSIDITIYIKKKLLNVAAGERNVDANGNTQTLENERLSNKLHATLQVVKLIFICYVLFQQVLRVDIWYFRITFLYVILVMKIMEKPLGRALGNLQLDIFEGLEGYFICFLLGTVEISLSLILMMWTLVMDQQLLMLVAIYTNVYTCAKDLVRDAVPYNEWMVLGQFPLATSKELRELDDVCAVCLCRMWRARRTPCRHFFHGRCLLRCLEERLSCPMCSMKFYMW